jgi:hypothetical protein
MLALQHMNLTSLIGTSVVLGAAFLHNGLIGLERQ